MVWSFHFGRLRNPLTTESMRYPLVSLNRHRYCVMLVEGEGFSGLAEESLQGLVPRRFGSRGQAIDYLNFWRGDVNALADLRYALQRSGKLGAGPRGMVPDSLLPALADQLLRGALLLYESHWQRTPPGRLSLPPASGASALDGLAALDDVPAPPVLPPLLPALEQVQIEGAEVMPEIMQSLAQTQATLGTLQDMTVSLKPAPDQVPAIQSDMEKASARLRQQLDEL